MHVSLYHVLGSMFYAIVTSDDDFFRECYGTLWNFLMRFMKRNNYASNRTNTACFSFSVILTVFFAMSFYQLQICFSEDSALTTVTCPQVSLYNFGICR